MSLDIENPDCVHIWRSDLNDYEWVPFAEVSNEVLLAELIGEECSEDRRISTDPPSRANIYRAEVLRRMNPLK